MNKKVVQREAKSIWSYTPALGYVIKILFLFFRAHTFVQIEEVMIKSGLHVFDGDFLTIADRRTLQIYLNNPLELEYNKT